MREHPVPQNVTSYEFHLVGNMTLKQFLELAAGCVLGLLVYSTNLPNIIKLPIIITLVAIGAMIAFVPFEGRPLDQWFIALIRAIYRPTEFYWKKSAPIPSFFEYTAGKNVRTEEEFDLSPYKHQRILDYISSLPTQPPLSQLDQQESSQISAVMNLFDQVSIQTTQLDVVPEFQKPNFTPTQHRLTPITQLQSAEQTTITSTIQIPEMPAVVVEASAEVSTPSKSTSVAPEQTTVFSTTQSQNQILSSAQQITTSTQLPFPKKPTQPNVVVGMVFDQIGNIVDQAIVEIIDSQGMPVRAVRTNSIGQFYITTPLKDGHYTVSVEKVGVRFSPEQLHLCNTLLDPLEIRAVA